jgi:hypothetical protein
MNHPRPLLVSSLLVLALASACASDNTPAATSSDPDAVVVVPDAAAASGSLCERSCASTARAACPLTMADCAPACEKVLPGKCSAEKSAYLECLAGLRLDQLECDPAGAPRAKGGACDGSLMALARCAAM